MEHGEHCYWGVVLPPQMLHTHTRNLPNNTFFVVSDFSLPLLWNGNGIVFRTYWKVLSKALDLVLNQPGLHEYFISLHCLEEINLHFEKSQAIDFATPMSAFLQQNPDMPSP